MSETVFYNNRTLAGVGAIGIGTTNLTGATALQTYTGSGQFNTSIQVMESTHATSKRAGLLLGQDTTSWLVAQDQLGNGTRDFFIYGGTTPSVKIAMLPGGNVGIGTTAPVSRLHVYTGASGNVATFVSTGGSGSYSNVDITSYLTSSNVPTTRIAVIDDGQYSGHFTVLTKIPGADGNALSERIRITSSGSMGIGTSTPQANLHMAVTGGAYVRIESITSGNGEIQYREDGTLRAYTGYTRTGGYYYFGTSVDALRLYAGATVPTIPGAATAGNKYYYCDLNGTSQFTAQLAAGTVSASASGLLTSSSDSRVKSNIVYFSNIAIPLIEQLKPAHFTFNDDPETKKIGFIAQDVEKVIPDAVDGKKYEFWWETNEDGSPKTDSGGNLILTDRPRYKGFDATAVLAVAVKAIQELSAKVTSLEQSLATVTANVSSLEARLAAAGL